MIIAEPYSINQIPLLGLDSFVAGLVIGPMLKSWRGRWGLAALFGLCDGVGSFMGAMLPHAIPDAPDILIYGVAATVATFAAQRNTRWLASLPIILAIDNLTAGAPATEACVLAISSGLMALIGIALSELACHLGEHLGFSKPLFLERIRRTVDT
jgi:hypothetical protein